jgi:hypothetical protein
MRALRATRMRLRIFLRPWRRRNALLWWNILRGWRGS